MRRLVWKVATIMLVAGLAWVPAAQSGAQSRAKSVAQSSARLANATPTVREPHPARLSVGKKVRRMDRFAAKLVRHVNKRKWRWVRKHSVRGAVADAKRVRRTGKLHRPKYGWHCGDVGGGEWWCDYENRAGYFAVVLKLRPSGRIVFEYFQLQD